jgi:hypothetical protein
MPKRGEQVSVLPADKGGMDSVDEQVALEDEEQDREKREVREWRFGQIRSLGFAQIDARLLADAGADLGLLRRLVGTGCPTELAIKIAL